MTVLERSVPGAEASSAAAGIIGAHVEARGSGPMLDLMRQSQRRHRAWSTALRRATGIDVGFKEDGILRVSLDSAEHKQLGRETRWMAGARLPIERLSRARVARLEPSLGPVTGGVLFRDDGRIDPPLFLRAVHIAAQKANAVFRSGAYVRRVVVEDGRARSVLLEDGTRYFADAIIVAAGSWTTLIDGIELAPKSVVPARGQIVELSSPAPVVTRIVIGPRCYLVPRDDGRTLIGSTLEFVGYRRDVTAAAVRDLLDAGLALAPPLAEATVSRMWSNFRPYTPDELPLIGPSEVPGLYLATGHFRTGILLAPITGEAIAAVVAGRRPAVDLAPFSPQRPSGQTK